MASTTFFPDASPESTSVDGMLIRQATTTSWDTTHDADGTSNMEVNDSIVTINSVGIKFDGSSNIQLGRGVILFDTSSLITTDIITAATLSLWVTAKENDDNDGDDFISIVQMKSSMASDTSLTGVDFNDVGSAVDDPTEGIATGTRADISSITTGQYTDFALNATGLAWVADAVTTTPSGATAGITYLGFREGHDILDNPPVLNAGQGSLVTVSSADEADTTQDPKLVVTFTPQVNISPAVISMTSSVQDPTVSTPTPTGAFSNTAKTDTSPVWTNTSKS